MTIAYKRNFTSADAPLQLAMFPWVKIPTASRPVGNGEVEGGMVLPIVYSVPNSPIDIGLSPELDRSADGDRHGHHWTMVQVGGVGWQVTEKLTLSGELWSQWDWDPAGTTTQVTFDPSAAYLLRNDLQISGEVDIGLNRHTPGMEVSFGFAKRF